MTAATSRRIQGPFDAIPVEIRERQDLQPGAKLLYAFLGSLERINARRHAEDVWQPSYSDLAERLRRSVRSIIRYVAELVEAGLVIHRRRGQGLTNLLTLAHNAVSRSDKTADQEVPESHVATVGTTKEEKKEEREEQTPLPEPIAEPELEEASAVWEQAVDAYQELTQTNAWNMETMRRGVVIDARDRVIAIGYRDRADLRSLNAFNAIPLLQVIVAQLEGHWRLEVRPLPIHV